MDAFSTADSPTSAPALPTGDEGVSARPDPPRRHILTIALEDYYHTGPFKDLISRGNWSRFERRLETGAVRALELLHQSGAKATFFALGWVADAAPELIRRITDHGHEMATRGYYHRALGEFSPGEFRDDVLRAREAIERASGHRILGFRVAEGWLTPADLWALKALSELGFVYDSSIKPILRHWAKQPHRRFIHREEFDGRTFWEIPFSSVRLLGLDVPIAGGNYFRQLPPWLVRRAVARWVRECRSPYVMYFHTWELDPSQPRFTGAPIASRIRQYRNLDRMPAILAHYLSTYRFTSIAESLRLELPSMTTTPQHVGCTVSSSRETTASRVAVSVIIPCYNEAASLPYLANTLRGLRANLEDRYDVRLILVDDGSADETWDVMNQLFAADPSAHCLRQPTNRGAAAAILRGIRQADTPIVCSIDADCTYDPHSLAVMIPLLTEQVDVVTASPYHPDGRVLNVPAWRLALSRAASGLYRLVFRHQLYTYTSCFRVYRRSVVAGIRLRRGGFVGMAEMLAHLELAGARIVEFPATLESRLLGHSKLRVLRTAAGHLVLMARLARLRLTGARLLAIDAAPSEQSGERAGA